MSQVHPPLLAQKSATTPLSGMWPPYASSQAHLLAGLALLELKVRIAVMRVRQEGPDDAYRGLILSDAEIDGVMALQPGEAAWHRPSSDPQQRAAEEDLRQQLRLATQQHQSRTAASLASGVPLKLEQLRSGFGLSELELQLMLIALAPEIDARFEKLYAYLQDNVTQRRPGVELALRLLFDSLAERLSARRAMVPTAPLLHFGLLHLFSEPASQHPPLLSMVMKVDERVVDFLHDVENMAVHPPPGTAGNTGSPRNGATGEGLPTIPRGFVPGLMAWARPGRELKALVLPEPLRQQLLRLRPLAPAKRSGGPTAPPAHRVINVYGLSGTGRKTLAEALSLREKRRLLRVEGPLLLAPAAPGQPHSLQVVVREAILQEAALCITDADRLLLPEPQGLLQGLCEAILSVPNTVYVITEQPWEPGDRLKTCPFLALKLEIGDTQARLRLWHQALQLPYKAPAPTPNAALPAPNETYATLELLAARFSFSAAQIHAAATTALRLSQAAHLTQRDALSPPRSPSHGPDLTILSAVCRLQGTPQLNTLARKVETPYQWDDLVVSRERIERLKEIVQQAQHRHQVMHQWGFERRLSAGRGLTVLFTGPPGTGKTMAAGVMAQQLGLDLYQIDLSSVVSKYIGETEKQLARIFDEAERSHGVLFFDEADALFGKRSDVKDAHDRYANIETSYLLQRMESYEGVAILATNFSRNMDDAFVRRLQFIVEFVSPDEKERRRIWERIWPPELPRSEDLDLGLLARRFELAGGYIRNIALASAFLAAAEHSAVGLRHVLMATRREYQKLGRVMDEALFQPPR